MPSTLTWIDHDSGARDRSLRILALFQEKESRDELGFGSIRDSFADQLFPGTSTIQTRLRYMLFVPWIYKDLEDRRISPGEFVRSADTAERDLIDTMRNADEYEAGVFGGRSGRQLKRLPSSVYWAGLGEWGIRTADLSQDQYHRRIGAIYNQRKEQSDQKRERGEIGDDLDKAPAAGTITWHQRLPKPPKDFPVEAGFALSQEEASFLLDRIQDSHPKSLLAHLALRGEPADIDAPWEHPDSASFPKEHIELLSHARIFSVVMHGAALIYNLALADARRWSDKKEEHEAGLQAWLKEIDLDEVRNWSLSRFWEITVNQDEGQDQVRIINPKTRRFVEEWVAAILTHGDGIGEDNSTRELIRRRETSLKKGRSRFTNRRALEQWGGSSGLGRMTYRWPTASTFLKDLYDGLRQDGKD